LQRLYDKYQNQGLEILAFPCNQFAEEEKGSNEEIAEFCELNYKVSFPLFSKINVNGEKAEPLFKFLKDAAKGFMGTTSVKWNFSKFLISKKGKVVKRFGSLDAPESFENDIQSELQ
jgi:glutathione peroxidase